MGELTDLVCLTDYEKEILPRIKKGETILVAAHGNSLRSCVSPAPCFALSRPLLIPYPPSLNAG